MHIHDMRAFLASILSLAFAVGIGLADPIAERFMRMGWPKTDFSKTSINLAELTSGGPPKDGIPAIDHPRFVPLAQATLLDREPVIGLEINGDARAYPLAILIWHEIVNDTVGGVPVAVTFCPLCNTAIVFDRRVDGKTLDFGTTGLLRFSDLVMYDRATESFWQQATGEAIVGAMTGRRLRQLPARLESWAEFKRRFATRKDAQVLVPTNPRLRPYGRNPYVHYDSGRPFLYDGDMPKGLEPMLRVVIVKHSGEVRIVTLARLVREKEMMLGEVRLRWRAGQASALDDAMVAKGRDVGTVIAQVKDGEAWRDIPYQVTFAFVAHAFHRGVKIVR